MPDLLKARTEDPQLHHLADIIAECGRRGHEMAESMLSFVRGSRKPSEQICIAHLFEAVELLLRSNLPDKVSLHLDVADDHLAVDANYTELQQVLLNLSLNAIQAMPKGGRLTLRAASSSRVCGRRMRSRIGLPYLDSPICRNGVSGEAAIALPSG
ncbi:sensory histidine kinase AtoS [compost metagenome]